MREGSILWRRKCPRIKSRFLTWKNREPADKHRSRMGSFSRWSYLPANLSNSGEFIGGAIHGAVPRGIGAPPPILANCSFLAQSASIPSRQLQRFYAVPQLRRLLELELPRRLAHALFQFPDEARPLLRRQTFHLLVGFERHCHVVAFGHRHQAHIDRPHDRLRSNPVPLVVLHLHLPPPRSLFQRLPHAVRHHVGVQNGVPLHVPRPPPHVLDQRARRSQEPFLIRVQDRHQRYLRQVQTFAQQVDADQHIELPRSEERR